MIIIRGYPLIHSKLHLTPTRLLLAAAAAWLL
jgi:hypothetical protein